MGRALKIAHVKTPTGRPDRVVNGVHADDGVVEKAKPTHENIIRLAPPLVITEEEIRQALGIIDGAMKELPGLKGKKEDEVIPKGEKDVTIGVEN